MGIADTEQQVMEELKQLGNEQEEDKKSSEELLEEAQEEPTETQEETVEETEESEGAEEEQEESEEEHETEESEEELTGAKFRHKLKAQKEETERVTRESQELRERLARLEGRADAAPVQEATKTEEIPDQEYEPEKYADYQNKKLEKRVQEMEAAQTRVNAERQWETMQVEHARIKPDYNEAKAFLLENETKKMKAQYPYATDAQIAQALKQGEYEEAGNAAKAGVNPVEHIEYLSYKAGYRAKAVTKESPKQKPDIKKIKKNAKKNASLIGGSSAGETGDNRSAEQLLNMSIDDIHKFGLPNYEKAIRKVETKVS